MKHLVDAHSLIWYVDQDQLQGIPIISADPLLDAYGVSRVW
jgi:hypothetical protein